MALHLRLSRREREILEILYRRGEASATEVRESMHDPPSYSAVRALLRLLEEKGHAKHRPSGRKYLFSPRVSPGRARRSALRHLLDTFFQGSAEQCVASILDIKGDSLSEDDLDRLSERIEETRSRLHTDSTPEGREP